MAARSPPRSEPANHLAQQARLENAEPPPGDPWKVRAICNRPRLQGKAIAYGKFEARLLRRLLPTANCSRCEAGRRKSAHESYLARSLEEARKQGRRRHHQGCPTHGCVSGGAFDTRSDGSMRHPAAPEESGRRYRAESHSGLAELAQLSLQHASDFPLFTAGSIAPV